MTYAVVMGKFSGKTRQVFLSLSRQTQRLLYVVRIADELSNLPLRPLLFCSGLQISCLCSDD
jgi:hypothetical protein